jgi:hypothetical protein
MNNAATPPQRALLGPVLQRYFCQYLIGQRRLSPCTISAYRDTFKLLISFLQRQHSIPADRLSVEDLQAPRVLAFLEDLERSRGNGARSRNARLAAEGKRKNGLARWGTSFQSAGRGHREGNRDLLAGRIDDRAVRNTKHAGGAFSRDRGWLGSLSGLGRHGVSVPEEPWGIQVWSTFNK